MKAQMHLKISAYALALLGFWSVSLTEYFSPVWLPASTALVVAGWFYEGPSVNRAVYRRIWMIIIILMFLFFPIDIGLSGNLLLPAVHLSMFAQAYFLLNRKNFRAYRRILVISFAQLLASTNLTTDILFAAVLAAYCVIAVYGVVLIYLQRGAGFSGQAEMRARESQGVPPGLIVSSVLLATLLVPLTLGFFYSAPRLRYALIARNNPIDALNRLRLARDRTGFTRTVQLGTYGRVQEDQTLAMRVELPNGLPPWAARRWRGGGLNIYDGVTWTSSRDFYMFFDGKKRNVRGKNLAIVYPRKNNLFIMDERYAKYKSVQQLDADPTLLKQIVYLEIPFSETIFGAGEIVAVKGPFQYGVREDFNSSYYIDNRQALPDLMSYTAYSIAREPSPAMLRRVPAERYEKLIEEDLYGNYSRNFLQLPADLNPRIKDLAYEITSRAERPYDKVNAIKNYLESQFTYSLDLAKPVTSDPLYDFLFVSRTGHCEYFATAMTVMCRIIGIPARLARGFQQGEWNEAGNFYEVRQRDAHAWVEVYFPGYGWISFDPSPRLAADEYFEGRRSPIIRALAKRWLQLQILWRENVIGYNETRRLRLLGEMKDFLGRIPQELAGFLGKVGRMASGFGWLRLIAGVSAIALTLAAFFGLRNRFVFPSLLWLSARSRRKPGTAFYARMLKLLEKRKILKPEYLTPREFLDMPPLRRHPMYADIENVTSIYYRVRYGGGSLAENETATVNNVLANLKRSEGHVTQPEHESKV